MTEIQFRSDMTVQYVDHMGSDESVIQAMLVSTDTQDAADDLIKQPGRINFLMRDRHGSPFEHTALTLYIEAPIMVFREWHRHRIGFSYNEMSGRYTVLPNVFYVPGSDRPLVQIGKPGAYSFVPAEPEAHAFAVGTIMDAHRVSYATYEALLEAGIAREMARSVLGVGIYSKMFVTLNARSCMSFLSLRTRHPDSHFPSFPQHEINMCADIVEEVFAKYFPLTHEAFNKNGRVAP